MEVPNGVPIEVVNWSVVFSPVDVDGDGGVGVVGRSVIAHASGRNPDHATNRV